MKRRRHSAETKAKAVLEALREDTILAEVAAKYEVHPKLLGQWKLSVPEQLAQFGWMPMRIPETTADIANMTQQLIQSGIPNYIP